MAIVAELITVVGADVSGAERGLASVDRGINTVARSADSAGPSFNAFEQVVVGGLRRIGEIAVDVGFALGGIAAGALRGAADAGMDFEATMSGVQAVLSPTAEDMAALSDAALRIGKDTSFGAGEAASAIEMLAKNGIGATDIINGMADATVALAAATGADLAGAADIASDAMIQFGLSTDEVSRAINGISGVTVASKFGIDDYRLALAQAGGVAGGLGVEFEDFNTAIAATSSLFASGSDAGTSFKTFLQRLVPDTNPAKDAMAELGLYTKETGSAFFDAQGNLKSMAEVAELLQNSLAGVSEEQRTVLLTNIFGTDAMRTAIGFTQQGAEGFEQFAASIAEVDAAAQATTRLDNLSGDIEALKGTLEVIGIEMFTAFNPAMREGVQGLEAFAAQFLGFNYTPYVDGLMNAITITRQFITDVRGFLSAPGENTSNFLAGIVANVQAQAPVWIDTARTLAVDWLTALVGNVQAQLPQWISALEPYARAAGAWIVEGGTYLLENLLTWRNMAVDWLLTNLPGWMDALAPYAVAFGNWVLEAIPQLLANFTRGTVELINIIGANLPGIITKLGEWALAFADWVVKAAPDLLRNLGASVGQILDAIGANLPGIIESLAAWGAAFVAWATEALPPLLTELGVMIGQVFQWIVDRAPVIGEYLMTWLGAFVEWVIPAAGRLIENLGTLLGELLLWATQQSPAINAELAKWGAAFGDWVMNDAWPATLEKLGEWWNSLGAWFQEKIAAISQEGSLGRALWDAIFGGAGGDMAGRTGGTIPGFASGVRNFGGGMAIVGERGPELVNLPAGSDVIPNNMLGGMGGNVTNVYVTVAGNVTTERDLSESVRLYLEEYDRRNG